MKKSILIAHYVDRQGAERTLPLDQDRACWGRALQALCQVYGLVWVPI